MSNDWNPNDPDATRVHYDLSRWTFDQQAELASDLADAEIPHAWDDAELLVPEEFEVATDAAISLIEERLGITDDQDLSAGTSHPAPIELGDDIVITEYDLAEWTGDERHTVGNLLVRQHIPFRWSDHVLLVATEQEEAVEAILDAVESGEADLEPVIEMPDDGEALPIESGSSAGRAAGPLPFETLTTFFLAGERLHKNPLDADGLEQLIQAIDVADPANPPYGVERPLWIRTCELADELADALAGEDEPDEDGAAEAAAELHDLLRPYV